jgi:hypothetical protein
VNKPEGVSVLYKYSSIELVIPDQSIDRCMVYSLTGQTIMDSRPASNRVELQNNAFKPGIYLVKIQSGKSTYVNKVVFR